MLRKLLAVSLISWLIIIKASISFGYPIVDLLVTVTGPVNGIWTYNYIVKVDNTSPEGIWCWDISLGDSAFTIDSPINWNIFSNPPNYNWIEWESTLFSADILPGNSLGGFSYQSYGAPGWVHYETEGIDPVTHLPTGNILTGFVLGATPEPYTLLLFGCGVFMGIRRLRSKLG